MLMLSYILIGAMFWLLLFWAGKNYKIRPFKLKVVRDIQRKLFVGLYDGLMLVVDPFILAWGTFWYSLFWPLTIVVYFSIQGLSAAAVYVHNTLTGMEGWLTKLLDPFTYDYDSDTDKEN